MHFPEEYADGKGELTLHDAVAEEVLVPAVEAPPTGWRVGRFPQGLGRMCLVNTPLWSLRPPMCPLWLIIGKAALRVMRVNWYADDRDAFVAQVERRSCWKRAKRGGVVTCGVVSEEGRAPGTTRLSAVSLAVRAIHYDPAVLSDGCLLAQCARRRCVAIIEILVQASSS